VKQPITWAILTGEYPPDVGGVADYTRIVAEALAAMGDEVHVWSPAAKSHAANQGGVQVHPLPDRYSPRTLSRLTRELAALRSPYRLLLQYTPNAFGMLGTNYPFALWLAALRVRPWVMFHELYMPLTFAQPVRHNALALAQRLMLLLLMQSTERAFVTIPTWGELLEAYSCGQPIEWLPIFSNIATTTDRAQTNAVREQYRRADGGVLLGHFGTYGALIRELLVQIVPPLLERDARRTFLLMGSGSEAFADSLRRSHPNLADRIPATGTLNSDALAAHLAACDLLVQPYPDGVSTRRGSLIAGMALGVPTVAPVGALSEPFWLEKQPIIVVGDPSPGSIRSAVERALADPLSLAEAGRTARQFYDQNLDVKHTVAALRGEAPSNDRRAFDFG
jgi:glycosyltransferase involved in cell wall biosynthesis